MEPFTAIGAVVNVAQLLEFAYNIVTEGYKFAHNTHGELEGRIAFSRDLGQLNDEVVASIKARDKAIDGNLSDDDRQLSQIAVRACEISTKLREALQEYHYSSDGSKSSLSRGLGGIKRAFLFKIKKKDLDKFKVELVELRSQLNTRFLKQLRENVHDLRLSNDDLKNLVADSNAEILDDLQSGRLLTTEDFHSHSNVQVIHLTAIHDGVERNQQSLESMTSLIRSLSPLPPREEVDPQTIVLIHEAAATGNLQKLRQFLPADSTTTLLDAEDDAGRTPLHSAAKGGQLATVDFLGQRGSNVNADDRNGCRPLHLALMNGHVDIAKLLVQDFGASESKTDYAGKTPAQYFDHPPLVLWMLKFETREGDRDEKGNTALIHAAIQGHVSSVQYLLDRKADVSAKNNNLSTALSEACIRGHRDVMALLLTHGANPSQRDQWGYTPFGRCVVRGNMDVLQVMLEKGRIDLEEQHTPYMHTALAEATRLRLYRIVGLLVKRGANVNVVDWLDNPVLSRAIVCCEATEVTEMLLEAGANPNTPNKDGWTPVHEAMHYKRWNLFPLLIKHGGDMNAKEKQGLQLPLLSLLVIQRQADLIKQLLLLKNDARVDFEATNRDGWKPLREACHHDHHGRAEIARMLLEAGASVWGRVNAGFMGTHTQWTCLMQAARQDSSEVIKLLVEHKADLEASDSAGWTALRIAVENRRDSAACTLLMLNADPQSRGRDDKTPFSRASRHELPGFFMLCKALGKG